MKMETDFKCKNCGMKHPISEVTGIKANIKVDPICRRYEKESGGESPEKVRVADVRTDDERFAKGELKPKESKRWINAKVLHKDDSPCGHEIGKAGFCPVCMDNQKPQSCPVCGTTMKKETIYEIPNMEANSE
jgi:hypothetical protein